MYIILECYILCSNSPKLSTFSPNKMLGLGPISFSSATASIIERLSMTLRQTANGKNETFVDCFQLSVQYSENIFICGE